MFEREINKLYWGFIFIMLGFRIQGFDILPDTVGYLFFASGFAGLASSSSYFSTAAKFNIPMIFFSLLSIYQAPAQGSGINFGPLGMMGIPLGIIGFALNLLVVYNLFMGLKDMAWQREQFFLANEADERWNHFKMLQIATVFSMILIFIPPVAFICIIALLVVSIIILVGILGYLKSCASHLVGFVEEERS